MLYIFFFFKQKTAYEMRISDWSSDVCSSDLDAHVTVLTRGGNPAQLGATPITVSELAQIVQGKSSFELFEPLETGVWISVDVDAEIGRASCRERVCQYV